MNKKKKVQAIVQQLNIIDDTLFQKMAQSVMWKFRKQMMMTTRSV